MESEKIPKKKSELKPEEVSLDTLELSIRAYNQLDTAGFKTLADIIAKPESYFTAENIFGFGSYSRKEVIALVKEKNLKFKE